MADLKTTNIYGDAYINNKVGINTNTPATRLQIGQLSPTAATEGLQFGDDTAARLHRINSGHIRATGGISSATFLIADNYLQTNNNLIYPSSQTATQRLEVGNASGNAWIDGITIAQGGNVTVYNNLTVNNNATVTNDLTVNGNTYLGNANNDTVYVNDTIRIGATDSGDASLFFGEGAVAGSDYGARWYWDSGYTFTWYTRNAGTDTALFDYVTNDTSYINWRRHFHMQNKEINYNAQVHFNAGTRFVGNNTSYLIFRSDSGGAGGILVQDGSATNKGYTGYWDSAGGGILNNTGNWAVRYNFGNANSGGTLYGDWTVNANLTVTGITMTNLTGAYQNTTVYDSPKTQSATPSRGIRAPASSIQFTDSYAIAPSWTFRSTGDWPVPYGIGWGTGGESSGIFQRYHSNGYSFGDMIFYTGNDGYGAFSFRRHTWEGTTHFAAGSGELNTELFRIDWSGNLTMLGTLNGSANSATLYANNGSYGAWAINGTRNGWGGIEFANNGVSLMMGSDTVGFHQNTNGWLFRVHNGSGFIYKGSWGGGTAATIFDSSNYTTLANGVLLRAAGGPGGYGDWNTFGNVTQTTNVITTEYFNLNGGSGNSNFPPVVSYTYGILANLGSNSDARAQVYISHAGNDLIFRGGWGTSSWQTWNRVLTNINQPYAYAMNQYTRTTDVPTFSGVYTSQIGINDGGMDCYINITDSNPTFNYEAYGGEFYFYGDKDRPSSLLYVGGIDVSRTIIANAISSRDYTRQLFPGGGYYHEGGSVTGAIKIRLPANTKSVYPMLSFTCHIYNYSTGTSRTFKIGGHYSNTQWYNPFAYCLSDNVGNLNVRFGYEGTYLCVWIGETNSGWSYPTVFITDFQNGYSAIDGIWMTGWSVTRVTAFDTVTNGPYTPGYFWNQNNDGASSGLDADLLDGNHASAFALVGGSSGQNFNANSIYPYEWIRFMTDAGIYWQSGTYAGHHIYPQAAWGMSFRSKNNGECGLQLRGNDNTSLGAVYSDGTSIGFLTAAFGWGASFTLAGTMNRGTVPLARIETITAYTILGNNNASAAAVPSALSVATVATMLSGQTMNINGSSTSCSGNAATATTATGLNSSNYISRVGSSGNYNTDFQNTPAGTVRHLGDDSTATNNPGGAWWFVDNYRHSNSSNYWGTQVAWGWEDNANKLATRNISNNSFGSWVYYLNSGNYTDYTVTKTGTGASGNWAINITGNAATVTNGIYTTSYYTGTPLGKRRYRIHTADSTSLNSSITSLECGFTYGGSGEPTGPFIAFGGLGGAIDYSCQLVGAYSGGGNDFKIRTRNDDTATWNTWRTIITDGNYTSYSPTLTGTGASGTWAINITGNAATATTATNVTIANGSVTLAKIENITAYTILGNSNASAAATPAALSVATVATMLSGQTMNINGSSTSISGFGNPTTAASGNTIAYRDGNGDLSTRYFFGSYHNSTDDISTGNITYIMAKFGDNYFRSATAAKVAAFITGQTMNINGSSTSCSGNAATATNATTAGGLAVQSGTNYEANKIVRTDGNGYILAGWINTVSGDNGTTAIDRVYASSDGYIRYYTPANFRTVLDVPTRTGGGVTNFGINVSPSNRLHVNGDGTNPAIRVDNGAVVLAASAASNSKTFYGWLPISIAGTTKWIQMYN